MSNKNGGAVERKLAVDGMVFCAHCDAPADVASGWAWVRMDGTNTVWFVNPACSDHADAPAVTVAA